MDIFAKLKDILYGFISKDNAIEPSSLLIQDLGLNSFEIAQLATAIEDEFDIEIADNKILSFQTPQDIVNYIEENQ